MAIAPAYAGVNPADVLQREGKHPVPAGSPKDVPGLEVGGPVVACGDGATAFAVGDRVFGLVGGGGLAQRVIAHERELARVPDALDDAAAAAAPEAFLTAFDAVCLQAGLTSGETLLVNGASGGVGTAAVQIAAFLGAHVVANVRAASCARVLPSWARPRSPPTRPSPRCARSAAPTSCSSWSARRTWPANVDALARGGRLIVVGARPGDEATLVLRDLMSRRGHLIGTTLRTRPLEEKAHLVQQFGRRIVPALADGRLRPIVDRVFPLAEAADALDHVRRRASSARCCSALGAEPADAAAGGDHRRRLDRAPCTCPRSMPPPASSWSPPATSTVDRAEAIAGPRGARAYARWEEMLEREELDARCGCARRRCTTARRRVAALAARHPRVPREADRAHAWTTRRRSSRPRGGDRRGLRRRLPVARDRAARRRARGALAGPAGGHAGRAQLRPGRTAGRGSSTRRRAAASSSSAAATTSTCSGRSPARSRPCRRWPGRCGSPRPTGRAATSTTRSRSSSTSRAARSAASTRVVARRPARGVRDRHPGHRRDARARARPRALPHLGPLRRGDAVAASYGEPMDRSIERFLEAAAAATATGLLPAGGRAAHARGGARVRARARDRRGRVGLGRGGAWS